MTTDEIAGKMWEITAEFQRRSGMQDAVIDKIVEHCFKKMELANQPGEYILLLLPDELKNYCFRREISARSIAMMNSRKGGEQNVLNMSADTLPPEMSECTGAYRS